MNALPALTNLGKDPERLLTTAELCGVLNVTPRTLDNWRYRGVAPDRIVNGRHVRYRLGAVHEWLAHCQFRPIP